MTLNVGTYSVTVPASAFHKTPQGPFVCETTISGVDLAVRLSQTGANAYQIQVSASGVDLHSLSEPVTVALKIGYNSGTTQVGAPTGQEKRGH
jgi:hypothetical protein